MVYTVYRTMRRLLLALALALLLGLINLSPASAQDLDPKDYFQLTYEPVNFDKTEINGSEVFHATIAGSAACTKDLPVPAPVSEASITFQIFARHAASGATVTLNPSYTITIDSFPSKKGETFEISESVPLQFPAEAESGEHNVIGRITKAIIEVGIFPIPVTDYLSGEQSMGIVKYTAPAPTETTIPPSPEPEKAPQATPKPTPATQSTPAPKEAEPSLPWWVILLLLIAVATIIFNIIWFLRHRYR